MESPVRRLPWGLFLCVLLVGTALGRTPNPPRPNARAQGSGHPQLHQLSAPAPWDGVGPVPDYALLGWVITHERLAVRAPELVRTLDRLLGERHVREQYITDVPAKADGVIWLRDHQPIYVRQRNGILKALRPLHIIRQRLSWVPPEPVPSFFVERLPLLHENGNLVATRRHVFVSARLTVENAEYPRLPALQALGQRARARGETLALLAEAFDRPAEDIVVLPHMPHEVTGHVDMVLMAIDDDTLLVPALLPEALRLAEPGEPAAIAGKVAVFLDETAKAVKALGYAVVRPPMLPPTLTLSIDDGNMDPAVISPTNGLLLRTRRDAAALMPRPDTAPRPPRTDALARRYAKTWTRMLRAHGWRTELVDVAELSSLRGLVRCVTAIVPAP
jgi:hypothetical protein